MYVSISLWNYLILSFTRWRLRTCSLNQTVLTVMTVYGGSATGVSVEGSSAVIGVSPSSVDASWLCAGAVSLPVSLLCTFGATRPCWGCLPSTADACRSSGAPAYSAVWPRYVKQPVSVSAGFKCNTMENPDPHESNIQRTQDVEPMLFTCWANVCDAGPTYKQHWLKILCTLTQCWFDVGSTL